AVRRSLAVMQGKGFATSGPWQMTKSLHPVSLARHQRRNTALLTASTLLLTRTTEKRDLELREQSEIDSNYRGRPAIAERTLEHPCTRRWFPIASLAIRNRSRAARISWSYREKAKSLSLKDANCFSFTSRYSLAASSQAAHRRSASRHPARLP